MHLLEVQLGVLHDRRDPEFTVCVRGHSSEPVSPQSSFRLAYYTFFDSAGNVFYIWRPGALSICTVDLGEWHALVMVAGYVGELILP